MIEIRNLRFERGSFLLEIPYLQVGRGITLLVGRNGAGKSTLLQLLSTALFPQQGEILYGGRNRADDLPLIRSQIGFVPTGIELYEEMRVKKFLRYMTTLKGGTVDEIDRLLFEFGLKRVENLKIKDLSQGHQQRLVVAQSLIGSPQYLFLDEPFNALDTFERKHLINYLIRYGKEHTILISTHDFSDWEENADHILWIDRGQILFNNRISVWKRGFWPDEPIPSEGQMDRMLTIEEALLQRLNSHSHAPFLGN